jgi:leucyl/phenylalanyl-tRNA--protein transferase
VAIRVDHTAGSTPSSSTRTPGCTKWGWAHSIETWRDGELVGGLYGLLIGRFFAGESMFHTATDASKVAMVATVEALRDVGAELFDVQWSTPHLASMGVVDVPRVEYLRRLATATS